MPNKSRMSKEAIPPLSPDGRADCFLGLTGPANDDGLERATEEEGKEVL